MHRIACWPLKSTQPWKGLYDWGEYPALLIGCGGMAVWIVSFFWKRIESWRDPGLFLALLLIVGPGLVVNVLIKPYWARPRPNATLPVRRPKPVRARLATWQRARTTGRFPADTRRWAST